MDGDNGVSRQDTKNGSTKATAAEEPKGADGSKTIYVLWGVGLGLLLAAGLICWLLVVPVLKVRDVVSNDYKDGPYGSGIRSQPWWVQERGVAAIAELGGPKPAAHKIKLYLLLPKEPSGHREVAAWLLGFCGQDAVPALAKLLKDDDSTVRYEAAESLGRSSSPEAVPLLIALLVDPRGDDNLRRRAATALGQIGDRRATEPLQAVLKDEGLSYAARDALEKIQHRNPDGDR